MKKLEFNVSKQNNVDTIKYELSAADVYDDRAADKASQLTNIIPFQYSDEDGKRSITSYAHEDTTLSVMYKSTLTKKEVLCLMSGLCAAFEIGAQGIPVSYIVKDSDYIFINKETLAVKCIIVPIKQDVMPLAEIPAFFRTVVSNMRFSEADKDNYVAELITQINADDFSVSKLKGLIDGQLEKMGLFISKDNGLMNMADNSEPKAAPKDIKVNKLGVMAANMQMNQPMGQPGMMPGMAPQMNQPMGQPGMMPQMNQPMGGQPQMAPQAPRPMGQPGMMPQMNQPMGGQPQMAPQAPKPMGQPGMMPGMAPQMNQPMGGQPQMAPQAPRPMGQPGMMPGMAPQMNQPMGQPQMAPQAPKPMGQPGMMPGMASQMNQPMGQPQMAPQAPRPMGQPGMMPGMAPQMNQPMGQPQMTPQAPQPMGGQPQMAPQFPTPVEEKSEEPAPEVKEEPVAEPAPEVKEEPVAEPAPEVKEEPVVAPTPAPVAPQPVAPTPAPVAPQSVAPTPVAPAPKVEEPPVTPRVEAPQPVVPPIMANSVKPVEDKPAEDKPVGDKPAESTPVMMGGQNGLVGQLGTKPIPHIVRKKTGETINITKSEFTIGKSKTKADYAIEDNTAISRVHCIIVQKDGVNYIKDNGSTNHTYINGVELQPGKEVLLKNKTVIQMGDEEFTFLLRKGE